MDRRQWMSGTFTCSRKKNAEGHQAVNESKCDPTPRRQQKVRFSSVLFKCPAKERQKPSRFFVLSANGRHPQHDRGFKKNLECPTGNGCATNQQEVAQIDGMPDPLIRTFYHQSFRQRPHLSGHSKDRKQTRSQQRESDCDHGESENSHRSDH